MTHSRSAASLVDVNTVVHTREFMSSVGSDRTSQSRPRKRTKNYEYAEWFGPDGDSDRFLEWYPHQATIRQAICMRVSGAITL
jgi:hypothetical protein